MKKAFLIIIVVFFSILIILGGIGIYLFNLLQQAPSDDANLYHFTITNGESASEIAQNLQAQGFVKNELLFRFWVKKDKLILQAGEYEIPKNLTVSELTQKLTLGTFDTQLTIIEGWRREEIADYLINKNILPEIIKTEGDLFQLRLDLMNRIKEGYFFPDTYTLAKNTTLIELIQIANDNFQEQINQDMQDEFTKQGLTLDEAVILASIVEREANTDESRQIVAGILLKRLKNDWPLEADATVQYAMADRNCVDQVECEWWPKEITADDLQIDSFFNTRKYPGLPPEAICNPSLSSLQAVASPSETEYWYYLTGKDGKMYYAKTLEEHNQNIEEQF